MSHRYRGVRQRAWNVSLQFPFFFRRISHARWSRSFVCRFATMSVSDWKNAQYWNYFTVAVHLEIPAANRLVSRPAIYSAVLVHDLYARRIGCCEEGFYCYSTGCCQIGYAGCGGNSCCSPTESCCEGGGCCEEGYVSKLSHPWVVF